MMTLRKNVILRRPHSGRLEGRSARSFVEFVRFRLLHNQLCSLAQHRWPDIEKAGRLQLLDPGQRIEAVKPEMRKKARGRHPVERAARAVAPAPRPHPSCLPQPVEG